MNPRERAQPAQAGPQPAPAASRAAREDYDDLGAEEVLTHAVERFGDKLAVACSFQKEASVILDMLVRIQPNARFFTLDTGVLFPETHAVWRAIEERYGIKVAVYQGISLNEQAARHGEALWARDPDLCCSIRKVAPLNEALSGLDAWVSGLRRDQSPTRAGTRKLAWDDKHGLWKLNPLADWSDQDVWRYIAKHDVPYHELHDRGYASIGCIHCTQASDGRGGRWTGTGKLECGIHQGAA